MSFFIFGQFALEYRKHFLGGFSDLNGVIEEFPILAPSWPEMFEIVFIISLVKDSFSTGHLILVR